MEIRDRIKELRRVKASELRKCPRNWRTHPASQRRGLEAILREVGFADALLAREVDGHLELIDGHLRQDVMGEAEVPVLVLDVTEEEANKLLVSLDPLAAMAEADQKVLDGLLASIVASDKDLEVLLQGMKSADEDPIPMENIDTRTVPTLGWALIGIPLNRFGELTPLLEVARGLDDAVVETSIQ